MRRVVALLTLTAGLVAFVALGTGAGSPDAGKPRYWAELDNAFGMTTGGDLKIAGVRAGKITRLRLDQRTRHAYVQFQVTQDGFGSLRADASCDTRPQSLIGEYFLDCEPGTSPQKLPNGGTITIAHTSTTVAPDLVNTILRRPYAERLSIIVDELGAGVAGNEQNLNDAVRRASPALRDTDKVLALLAKQNGTLQSLVLNADKVVGDLAAKRIDIGHWVDSADHIAKITATRKQALAQGFAELPGFLEQLAPTMRLLGQSADAQTPALRDLGAASPQLRTLFERLGPFATASRPATRALGRASVTGTSAVKAAAPVAAQLKQTFAGAPEASTNLAMILEHLNDPQYYAEADQRAADATGRAMPTGYTGLEAPLSYLYDQTQSTNVYDQNSHALKVAAIAGGDCAGYADVATAKKLGQECASSLGPNQPGINFTDKTDDGSAAAAVTRKRTEGSTAPTATATPSASSGSATPSGSDGKPSGGDGGSGGGSTGSGTVSTPPVSIGPVTVPGVTVPTAPSSPVPAPSTKLPLGLTAQQDRSAAAADVLDYLLGT